MLGARRFYCANSLAHLAPINGLDDEGCTEKLVFISLALIQTFVAYFTAIMYSFLLVGNIYVGTNVLFHKPSRLITICVS